MKRKIIPILLVLTLLLTVVPFRVSAAKIAEGTAGIGVYWKFYSDGQLYISGKGAVEPRPGYPSGFNAAYWNDYFRQIKSVTIYDGITSIGNDLFFSCFNLTKVIIPKTVTEIGDHAFKNCYQLTEITFPEKLKTIGDDAFSGTSLTEIKIPDSVTVIGSGAFEKTNISEITVPALVSEFGSGIFSDCSYLVSVKFLNTMTSIPRFTFSQCEMLEDIQFIGGISGSIGSNAFSGCTALKNFTVPEGITEIGDYAFYRCSGLETVTLPDGLLTIEDDAFRETGITELTIPDSLTYAGDGIFSFCDDLTSLTVPSAFFTSGKHYGGGDNLLYVHVVGDKPLQERDCFTTHPDFVLFYDLNAEGWDGYLWGDYIIEPWGMPEAEKTGNCGDGVTWSLLNGILTISGTGTIEHSGWDNPWELLDSRIHSVIIEPGITSIGDSAFSKLENLRQVTIANTVESIGVAAFGDCTGLTEIVLPEGVTEIKFLAFSDCNQLNTFIMSDSVTSVHGSIFTNCSALETVHLSDALTSIPQNLFEDCRNLKNFNIPKAATAIGDYAFSGCSRLTEFTVPEHITAIGSNAFRGTGITEFFIPPWVEDITTSVFNECRYLDTIHFQGNPPEYPDFRDMTLTIYYPANNEAWKDFEFEDYGGTITWIACETVHDLQEITIPATCTEPGAVSHGCACGYGLSSEELPALGHSFDDKVCIRCGLEESALPGDVDGNGTLNYSDALMILRASIGLETLKRPELADVNGDGASDYSDALIVLRRSIGLD